MCVCVCVYVCARACVCVCVCVFSMDAKTTRPIFIKFGRHVLLPSVYVLTKRNKRILALLNGYMNFFLDYSSDLHSFSLFSSFLETVPRTPTTSDLTITLMFQNLFSSLARYRHLLSFRFLLFLLSGPLEWLNPLVDKAFHLVKWLSFWWGIGNPFLSRDPKDFMRLIFKDRLWFVHVSFDSMGKLQSLAEFSVDHLSH